MGKFNCGVIPYVKVRRTFDFGDVRVWPNTASEWLSNVGHDHSDLTEMYRDSKGTAQGASATIITFQDVARDDFASLADHVVGLSTIDWLQNGQRSSDEWIVDFWDLPDNGSALGLYPRRGKFTLALTSSKHDLVYPPPLTSPRTFDLPRTALVTGVEAELTIARADSQLSCLTYLHRARFQLPFYSSAGDDVETVWSALESAADLPKTTSVDEAPEWASLLPRKIRRLAGRVLSWKRRTTKDELLVNQVVLAFGGESAFEPRCLDGLRRWSSSFYRTRSIYTHGGGTKVEDLYVPEIGLDQFRIGLHVAESLVRLRLDATSTQRSLAHLDATFRWKQTFDEFTTRLVNSSRTDWYPTCTFENANLKKFRRLLRDVARHRGAAMGKIGPVRRKKAAQKMGLVLSAWISALLKAPPGGVNLAPVAALPGQITKLVKLKKPAHEVDQEVAGELRFKQADKAVSYQVDNSKPVPSRLLLGGELPLWEWIGAYIDLNDIA